MAEEYHEDKDCPSCEIIRDKLKIYLKALHDVDKKIDKHKGFWNPRVMKEIVKELRE